MADRIDSRDLHDAMLLLEANEEFLDDEEKEELAKLRAVIAELEENCEERPYYGITMVPENDFTEYTQELIDECYSDLPIKGEGWPYRHITIDWEEAAEELKVDYAEIEYEGVTYLCR